jgi:hypothetical protein
MTRLQIISEFTRINRKYESLYFPKVAKAIASKRQDVLIKLKSGGIDYAKNWLSSDLGNTLLTDVVTELFKTVGLRHARMNYSRMLNENGRKGYISGMEVKGFGFNQIWTQFLIEYFRTYLLQKITYDVAATTRAALLAILATATTEGWSVDQTVDKVEGWNERYQAARVVRTEVGRAANVGAKANSDTLSYEQQKEWVSAHDFRVRGHKKSDHANHIKLDKTKIDAEDKFVDSVNGDQLDFPGDIAASAASVINCRCMVVYTAKRDENGNLIPKRKTTTVIYPGQFVKPTA